MSTQTQILGPQLVNLTIVFTVNEGRFWNYPKVSLNVLGDGGATISLTTFSKARDTRLVGETVKISVIKVGEEKQEMSSYLYKLRILDKEEK